MSSTRCSTCEQSFEPEELNILATGQVCDSCLALAEVEAFENQRSHAAPWTLLTLGLAAATGLCSVSTRTVTNSSVQSPGLTIATTSHGLDLGGTIVAISALTVLLLAIGFALRGRGVQRVLIVACALVTLPLAGFRLYQAMPWSEVERSGPVEFCAEGDWSACNNLGVHADRAGDLPRATEYFEQACDLGGPLGCRNLGRVLSRSSETPDWSVVRENYQRGCAIGDGLSCTLAAEASDTLGDQTAARNLYVWGCALDEPIACLNVGIRLEVDSPTDPEAIYESYEKSCTLKYGPGCLRAYGALLNLPRPDERVSGLRLITYENCEMGVGEACTAYGALRDSGIGAPPNRAEAVAAFEKGCSLKTPSTLSCLNAGSISPDPAARKSHLEKACTLGEERACKRLAGS